MFLGNMQSFYRRNSIHSQSSSQGSKSKSTERFKKVKHLSTNETGDQEEEDRCRSTPVRRRSFSISRNANYEEKLDNNNRSNVPTIKIGLYEPEPVSKTHNILKEKEKALWYNISPESDNSERLGPNKNNIIEESLERDKKQKT